MIEHAYHALAALSIGVLMVLAILCLIRCIKGPRISDRVLAVNMTGTLTIIMVTACVVLLGEGYLADIAILYAMVSFLAVVLLSKVYMGIYRERRHEQEEMRLMRERQQKEGQEQ